MQGLPTTLSDLFNTSLGSIMLGNETNVKICVLLAKSLIRHDESCDLYRHSAKAS
jgi:hypothetical protein